MSCQRAVVVGLGAALFLAGPASAKGATVGTTGASFLKLSVGARAEAMGDVGVVGLDGVESLYWNPAGLAVGGGQTKILVSHQQLWQGVSATAVAVGLRSRGFGSLALGIEQLGVGAWNNLDTGAGIDASDLAILLGFGRSLTSRMAVGVTGRTLHSTIGDHSASGFSLDCGLRYCMSDHLVLAGAVRNMGPGISFGGESEDPLPISGSLGGALECKRFSLLGEVRKERGTDAYAGLGLEFRVHPILALRMGSRMGASEQRATSDMTWGTGIGLRRGLGLDYSYRDCDLGSTHQFSGTYLFGGWGGGENARSAPGEGTAVASHLAVVKGLLASAVDSLVLLMPTPSGREVLVRRAYEPAEEVSGRGNDASDESDGELLEAVLVEQLTRSGLAVHLPSGAGAVEDSLADEAVSSAIPVLEYRILELKVSYPSGGRRHYVGRKEVERLVLVHLHLRLMEGSGAVVRWAGAAERSYRDVVPFSLLPSLRSEGFGFTDAETEDRKWDRILEPVIATAIVGGLVYLFYSNKGSD